MAKPQYLAPEIFKKEGYSYKADIWSLGITFYQLMNFSFPFKGDNAEEIKKNILEGNKNKELNNEIYSKKFEELIDQMLSDRPDVRPSAEEILGNNIIKSRIECYLKENGFDNLKSQKTIKEYENEIQNLKQSRRSKKEREIVVADDYERDDLNDRNEEYEAKRIKKIIYDFNRQMTLMKTQIIHKSITFKKNDK